jgi:hypothetical protein
VNGTETLSVGHAVLVAVGDGAGGDDVAGGGGFTVGVFVTGGGESEGAGADVTRVGLTVGTGRGSLLLHADSIRIMMSVAIMAFTQSVRGSNPYSLP